MNAKVNGGFLQMMKAGIVQQIFNKHYPKVDAGYRLDNRSRWAAWNIQTCRTMEQGYHIDKCPNGHLTRISSNSCKHRACPLCGATETELWIERQCAKELRCPHHQIVYTSPDTLRPIWRWNRKLFTNLYFRAAWHALRALLASPRLGGLPGVVATFQSWSDQLGEHLHLHFIVTSGGLSPAGAWIAATPQFLVDSRRLADDFRDLFIDYLLESLLTTTKRGHPKPPEEVLVLPPQMTFEQFRSLIGQLAQKSWHVDVEPAEEHPESVLKYVGRYIRRGPLSERRIVACNDQKVVIAYAHPEKHTRPTFTLEVATFILRLLTHVPAKGTHCVRGYGLYNSACREKLNLARAHFNQPPYEPEEEPPDTHELLHRMFPDFTGDLCPECHARLVTVFVERNNRSPPWETTVCDQPSRF